MKIQRILTATIRNKENAEIYFQIVLAFTDRKEFTTWEYQDGTGYFSGHYFKSFEGGYDDFILRYSPHGQAAQNTIEYSARQIGQAEIIWEDL